LVRVDGLNVEPIWVEPMGFALGFMSIGLIGFSYISSSSEIKRTFKPIKPGLTPWCYYLNAQIRVTHGFMDYKIKSRVFGNPVLD
jgi:hypothetical protein